MKTHVCLVSDQLLPNVLPVLQEQPERVVLLVSDDMQERGEILEKLLRDRGRRTASAPIPPYDFEGALAACAKVIEQYGADELTLNATGGTKVAALAAFQQFFFDNRRIIYTDTANNRILELGDHPGSAPLTGNLLKVRECLACCGMSIHPDDTPRREIETVRKDGETTRRLAALLIGNPDLLRDINRQIARVPETRLPLFIDTGDSAGPGGEAYNLLMRAGIAEASGSQRLCVRTAQNRFYLHGGWLEEYVYNSIVDLRAPGLDCRLNVGIAWRARSAPARRTTNELDVLFTHKNRLHIISCKTAAMDKEGGQGTGALYELDTLKDKAGGLFAQPMLVSVHRLREADFQRAEALKIKVVSGEGILRLKELLRRDWGIGA